VPLGVYLGFSDACFRFVRSCASPPAPPTPADPLLPPSLPFDTALAIFLQQQQKWTRKTARKHRSDEAVARYVRAYRAGVPIWDIARGVGGLNGSAPAAQPFLLHAQQQRGAAGGGSFPVAAALSAGAAAAATASAPPLPLPPLTISAPPQALATPSHAPHPSPYLLARTLVQEILRVPKGAVGALMKEPARISDPRLRAEVMACATRDPYSNPGVDRVHLFSGSEHEYRLQRVLASVGLAFEAEDDLRAMGYPRTPDAKLTRPVVVRCPHAEAHAAFVGRGAAASSPWPELGAPSAAAAASSCAPGSSSPSSFHPHEHLVCWIDSKASFGDPYGHGEENAAQLRAYSDLYGPGLVIYWHGFVETLSTCITGGGERGAEAAAASAAANPRPHFSFPTGLASAAAPSSSSFTPASSAQSLATHPDPRLLLATTFPSAWRHLTDDEWRDVKARLPPPPAQNLLGAFGPLLVDAGAGAGGGEEDADGGETASVDFTDGGENSQDGLFGVAAEAGSGGAATTAKRAGDIEDDDEEEDDEEAGEAGKGTGAAGDSAMGAGASVTTAGGAVSTAPSTTSYAAALCGPGAEAAAPTQGGGTAVTRAPLGLFPPSAASALRRTMAECMVRKRRRLAEGPAWGAGARGGVEE
jgi:CDAN1-interacting nuclease 1